MDGFSRFIFRILLGRIGRANDRFHGIDFVEAQALWKSKIVLLPAKDALEKRYLVIGTIGLGPLVCDYHLSWRDNSDY